MTKRGWAGAKFEPDSGSEGLLLCILNKKITSYSQMIGWPVG